MTFVLGRRLHPVFIIDTFDCILHNEAVYKESHARFSTRSIVPIAGKRNKSGVAYQSRFVTKIAYDRAVVRGDTVILSGGSGGKGRPLPVQEQPLDLSRAPDGTLYMDKHGSKVTTFRPNEGLLEIDNALGFMIQWRRMDMRGTPAPSAANELEKLFNLRQQGALSEDEFETAKEKVLASQFRRTRGLRFAPRPVESDGEDMYLGVGGGSESEDDDSDE